VGSDFSDHLIGVQFVSCFDVGEFYPEPFIPGNGRGAVVDFPAGAEHSRLDRPAPLTILAQVVVKDTEAFGTHNRESAVPTADARVHSYSALEFGYLVEFVVEFKFYLDPDCSASRVAKIEECTFS
jgi:hypothetical protein